MLTMEAQNIIHGSMDIVIEEVGKKMTQCQIMFFMTRTLEEKWIFTIGLCNYFFVSCVTCN